MKNNRKNILFLSVQSSHTKIFESVIRHLDNDYFNSSILDVSKKEFKIPVYTLTDERIDYVKNVISTHNPDLIIVANDQGIASQFIKVGKLKSIPSLAIQDGVLVNEINWKLKFMIKKSILWRLLSAISNWRPMATFLVAIKRRSLVLAWGYGGATHYAVIGKSSKDLLELRGVKSDRIYITGYALLDEINQFYESESDEIKILDNRKIILFLAQPLHKDGLVTKEQETQLINSLIENIDFSNYSLIIKLHPRDDPTKYDYIKNMENILIVKDANIHSLVKKSSIITTFSSTAGLWAIGLKKPLIVLDVFDTTYPNIVASIGIRITNVDMLKDTMKSLQDFKYDNKKIVELLYSLDGKASERIANKINEILHINN